MLACGAELKSTFCLAKGGRAWVGHHIGDLKNWETLRVVPRRDRRTSSGCSRCAPAVVAHDLHPDYLSTGYALAREGVEHVAVQHHHAHLAACSPSTARPARRWARSSTARGSGRTARSGAASCSSATWRAASAPGTCGRCGSPAATRRRASRGGWRARGSARRPPRRRPRSPAVDPARRAAIAGLLRSGTAAPVTTSAGRLFDAVAALCGLRAEVSYEGQAAIELEAACDPAERGAYPLPVTVRDGALVLDARASVAAAAADVRAGVATGRIAARFHHGLADATAAACARIAAERRLDTVVLSGGVFQNLVLLARTRRRLAAAGLRVLVPRRLPANDGGIAFGQAAVAAARTAEG